MTMHDTRASDPQPMHPESLTWHPVDPAKGRCLFLDLYMMMPAGVAQISATTGEDESLGVITMDGAFDFEFVRSLEDAR